MEPGQIQLESVARYEKTEDSDMEPGDREMKPEERAKVG